MQILTTFLSLVLIFCLSFRPIHAAVPQVVVTIAPIHGIVTEIMSGVSTPVLLFTQNISPHDYTLRPSDVRLLRQADIVFWIGEEFETSIVRLSYALSGKTSFIPLKNTPDLLLLPVRKARIWYDPTKEHHSAHEDEHDDDYTDKHHMNEYHEHEDEYGYENTWEQESSHDHHDHGNTDMHIWLNTQNAQAIARTVSSILSNYDPTHADTYQRNLNCLLTRLKALESTILEKLQDLSFTPYIVYHDAFQYFEQQFHLHPLGTITLESTALTSPRHLQTLRNYVQQQNIYCLFYQPQFAPTLAKTLTSGTQVHLTPLDPLGTTLEKGQGFYQNLLLQITNTISNCLRSHQ